MMKHALCAVRRPLGMMKKNFLASKKRIQHTSRIEKKA